MTCPVYKVGDRVRCWIGDGVASGWDYGTVAYVGSTSAHFVWVDTKTAGSRYYHQGDTQKIRHLNVIDELAEIGRRA